jgi:integrase
VKYRPLIATLVFTGLRIQEALGLVWEDVDLEAGLIRIRFQLTGLRERSQQDASSSRRKGVGAR